MVSGTPAEIYNKIVLEGIELTMQEFYAILSVAERLGFARKIGKQKKETGIRGRQPTVYEMNLTVGPFRFFPKNQ
jgi:hypothetical protein